MAKELEIRHCRVLVAVADAGGIAAAARVLGCAQSTVSEALLSLERIAGTPVMVRRQGFEAVLTPAARELLPHARAMISASEAALAAVSPRNRRTIRVGAIESLSSYLLPKVLASLRHVAPTITVQVTTGICDDLRRLVQTGELDVSLTVERLSDSVEDKGGHARCLGRTALLLIAREQDAAEVTRATLATRRLLVPDPEGTLNTLVERWFGTSHPELRLESAGSVDGVKRGVRVSGAVGVLPAYSVAEELASGALVELRPNPSLPDMVVELTTQRHNAEDLVLQTLIEMIEAALGQPAGAGSLLKGGH